MWVTPKYYWNLAEEEVQSSFPKLYQNLLLLQGWREEAKAFSVYFCSLQSSLHLFKM